MTKLKNNPILITVVVAVIVGAVAFFGGMQYQKMQRAYLAGGTAGRAGRFGQAGANGNFRPVRGEIIASDDKSITVKLMDGSSKIVLLSGNVAITEATSAGKTALVNGKQVMVFGAANPDGSVTAQNIQLNPTMGRPGAGQGGN